MLKILRQLLGFDPGTEYVTLSVTASIVVFGLAFAASILVTRLAGASDLVGVVTMIAVGALGLGLAARM